MIHNSRFLRTETTCSTCFSLPSHEKYWLPLLSRVFSPPRPLRAPPLEGGSLTSTLTHSGKSIEPASPSFERSTCARGKEGRKERRGEDNRGSSGECSESPPSNFTSLHFTLFSPDFELGPDSGAKVLALKTALKLALKTALDFLYWKKEKIGSLDMS